MYSELCRNLIHIETSPVLDVSVVYFKFMNSENRWG